MFIFHHNLIQEAGISNPDAVLPKIKSDKAPVTHGSSPAVMSFVMIPTKTFSWHACKSVVRVVFMEFIYDVNCVAG